MKKIFPSYVRVVVIFFLVFWAMESFIDSGAQPAFIKYPMVSLFLLMFLFLLVAIEITISAVDNISYNLLTAQEKQELLAAEKFKNAQPGWYDKFIAIFTKSDSKEVEGELLLDHDYDGIKELDNTLPTWWVYLFYGTIIFAVVYLVKFEILGGDNQEMELQKALAQAKIEVAEYKKTAPDLMDENTVTLLTDPGDLTAGKTIFETNCAACHRADGGGQVGPNLTDDHWILGGGIKEIFHTVSNGGRDGKGMIAWKSVLKPKEIQEVSSYILSIQGSNPPEPKAPEGEVWVEPTN